MPLSLYSYQKFYRLNFYLNLKAFSPLGKSFEEQKGQTPEYVFVLIKIYESCMALESVL